MHGRLRADPFRFPPQNGNFRYAELLRSGNGEGKKRKFPSLDNNDTLSIIWNINREYRILITRRRNFVRRYLEILRIYMIWNIEKYRKVVRKMDASLE